MPPTTPLSAWRGRVLDRQAKLSAALGHAKIAAAAVASSATPATAATTSAAQNQAYEQVDRWLQEAHQTAITLRPIHQRITARWRGSDIDSAWTALHRAEATLVGATPDLVVNSGILIQARERARQRLKPRDSRLLILANAENPVPAGTANLAPGTMDRAARALAAALSQSDDEHRRIRSFRNLLIAATFGLLVVAGTLAVVGALWPQSVPLCWTATIGSDTSQVCPSGSSGPAPSDVALVELFGVCGAAISAAFGIRRLRGTSTPYGVPLMSLLIKLPLGALTAVVGLAVLHLLSGFSLNSQPEFLAYAIIFGVSQEAVTQLIDRQAQAVLGSIKPQNQLSGEPAVS